MHKNDLTKMVNGVVKSVKRTAAKRSPEILIATGIVGMITTCIMAVKATPKAMQISEELAEKHKQNGADKKEIAKDYVIKVAPVYIPSVVTGGFSIACIVGGNSMHVRRSAALATACTLTKTAFDEYKDVVVETIGEKKEEAIRDKVAKQQIDKHPMLPQEVILTEKGTTLFFDMSSGRYFRHDIEKIRKVENILNKRLLNEMYIALNEYYYEIGLPCTTLGNELGWNAEKTGLIELRFSAQLTESGEPCIAIDYTVGPRYDYSSFA